MPYSNCATPAVSIAGLSILVLKLLLLATPILFPILLFVCFKHELSSFSDDNLSSLLKNQQMVDKLCNYTWWCLIILLSSFLIDKTET